LPVLRRAARPALPDNFPETRCEDRHDLQFTLNFAAGFLAKAVVLECKWFGMLVDRRDRIGFPFRKSAPQSAVDLRNTARGNATARTPAKSGKLVNL
jgi:hypothetical protein